MSEYQYYEFRSIDRSLTQREMSELRALSTRAQITPTSFTNEYQWGDFKGDPNTLMEKYFDAFLYYANWGTHRLMLRLPRQLVDVERASAYCIGDNAALRERGDHVILEFEATDEDGDYEDEPVGLASLIPLRADLMAGDLRALYLGWLLCAQMSDLDDEEEEPPVPPGLGELTGSLQSFAEFLRIDPDLIDVAAERSDARIQTRPSREEWIAWIRRLPDSEKEALLLRVAEGQDAHLHAELLQRFRQAGGTTPGAEGAEAATAAPRTAAELLEAAERRAEERRLQEAERKAAERARLEREQAAARATYLNRLEGREPELWQRVEAHVATKKPKEYDEAVRLLVDLRDLSGRTGREAEFQTRIHAFRERHAMKVSFIARLDRAHVGTTETTAAKR